MAFCQGKCSIQGVNECLDKKLLPQIYLSGSQAVIKTIHILPKIRLLLYSAVVFL
jgi:hypothetical protein